MAKVIDRQSIKVRIIEKDNTILETMKVMDERKVRSLLVFSKGRFIGMITIGDLQRAIIANKSFDTKIGVLVDNAEKKYASIYDNDSQIKEWMLKMRAEMMPVLNDAGELVNVIFWDELFNVSQEDKRQKLDVPVVIMAGGKGTRLKPITNVIPKPMIPIGEKTILEVILDQFENIGCHKFYISVNYKADMMKYFLSQLQHKYNVEFFQEDKPLGTIGSVSLLKGKIRTPFFVSNCDSINEQDYRDVWDYHVKNNNDMTIVTMIRGFKIPYGVIETGEDGLMIDLKEKPEQTYQVNTGVYILNPEVIDEIPEGEFFHITHLMEKVKARGGRVGCFPVSERSWKDVGEWHEYLKMINVL